MDTTVQPIDDFCVIPKNTKDTEQFKEILNEVRIETSVILFVHGFPGTGKTTLLQKLGNLFPYHKCIESLRYHISCNSNGQDLKSGFRDLIKRLKINDCELVINEVNKNKSGMLVDALCESCKPILLVIEDVQPNSHQLFLDFLRNFNTKCNFIDNKFHIYVANRCSNLSDLFQDGNEGIFKELRGFTEKEGTDYLIEEQNSTEVNIEAGRTIVKRFSGSPLGLHAAKKFCEKCDIDYKKYNDFYVEDIKNLTMEENKLLQNIYGNTYEHIFHAITMPFVTEENTFYWKVMSCIAYINHTDIPHILIASICRELEGKKGNVKLELNIGKLKSELKTYGLCKIKRVGDSVMYNFHEVVLHAFKCKPCFDIDPLKIVIFAMSTLITRDMRDTASLAHMKMILPHLNSVLQHCKVRDKSDNPVFHKTTGQHLDFDWALNELLLANLLEVRGSVVRNSSFVFEEESENELDLAVQKVWSVINHLTDGKYRHEKWNSSRIAEDNIKNEVKLCQNAAEKLNTDFIAKYEAKVISCHFTNNLDFLQGQCKAQYLQTFMKFKQIMKNDMLLDVDKINILRECELFLKENDHRKIFFVERLALPLHSRSRTILYRDFYEKKDCEICKLDSEHAFQLTKECQTKSFTMLSQFLSRSSGYFPLALKENDVSSLENARTKCQLEIGFIEKGNIPLNMYEHGLLKEWREVKNQIQLLSNLVNINRKLYNFVDVSESKSSCDKLMDILTKNIDKKISHVPESLVVCGRLYSLLGDHEQALKCFDTFFNISDRTGKASQHIWATLQYARAVEMGKIHGRVNSVIKECKRVLYSQKNLNQNIYFGLRTTLQKLENF